MRDQTREFVVAHIKKHQFKGKVLDVGSMNVSGEIRSLFHEEVDYTGVDMRAGENVDIVLNGHNLTDKFEENSFDLVCCFDTMEHDDKFWLTIEQCKKVLKPGGYLMIGAPGPNCPKHDHPNDYWRFNEEAFKVLLEDMEDVHTEEQTDTTGHALHDEVYGSGRKK